MKNLQKFGRAIRKMRLNSGLTITEVARDINVDRSYLSRIEHGKLKPSTRVLEELLSKFHVGDKTAREISRDAGISEPLISREILEKDVDPLPMTDRNIPTGKELVQGRNRQVTVPNHIPVLYSDSIFITTSPWGIVFDFAQNLGATNQQVVVSRIGISKEHASRLVEVLNRHLKKK